MEKLMDLTVGDWSDDGHGKTEKKLVMLSGSDLSREALAQAYTATCEKLGFDLCKVFYDTYDTDPPQEFFQMLWDVGYFPEGTQEEKAVAGETEVDATDLFLWWLKQSMADLSWKIVEAEDRFFGSGWFPADGYGYGLFY